MEGVWPDHGHRSAIGSTSSWSPSSSEPSWSARLKPWYRWRGVLPGAIRHILTTDTGIRVSGLIGMLSAAYAVAQWAEYVCGAVALLALAAIATRLRKRPRGLILGPLCVLVSAAVICAAAFVFSGTRVQQVSLNSIKQVGLETHHAGLRTNALIYEVRATTSVTPRLLPPTGALSDTLNHVIASLAQETITVDAKVAVYGLINFATLTSRSATVNRQTRTVTVSLPDPEIGPDTTYIASVSGVQVRGGPLYAVAKGLAGVVDSLFHRPVVSFSAQPALTKAETVAVAQARQSQALEACGRQEITQQVTHIFQLTPQYKDYRLSVTWPTPTRSGVNCPAVPQ